MDPSPVRRAAAASLKRILAVICIAVLGVAASFAPACSKESPPRPLVDAAVPDAAPDAVPPDAGVPRCTAPPRPPPASRIELVRVFPNLTFNYPLGLFQAPGDSTRWYVVEQTGQIKTFLNQPNVATATDFLAAPLPIDIGATWEGGLLGFAFHPSYATNGTAFLAYTVRTASPGLTQRIARFKRNTSGLLEKDIDIFERAVPADSVREEHNFGSLVFGADGLLYASLGDAYVLGDNPAHPSQDPNSVFGKILRIAVSDTGTYTIPQTNPYAAGGGAPEVYARGFRNVWRMSFDRANPTHLWAGDVGDDTREEINRVELGKNYGWSIMEGPGCHAAPTCNTTGLELPIVSYPRKLGLLAVIGGYVYRGTQNPSLVGSYFYGDFSGRIWSLPNGQAPARVELDTGLMITSFAEDNAGELYVIAYETMSEPAQIFRIVAAPPGAPSEVPTKLSLTGCVDPAAPATPGKDLIPFDVNSPLWSDGAEKRRWLSVPPGSKIHVRADGDLELPVGSVVMKEFRLQGKPVETRLFVRHVDGDWGGYTYEWADDGSDAYLLNEEKFEMIGGQEWFYPSTAQCLRCHTTQAGRTLGLEIAQLNKTFTYPHDGQTKNQLVVLEELGLFDRPIGDPALQPRLPDPLGAGPVDARARSYLHANCAFCHRPGASPRTAHDLQFSTSVAGTNTCNVAPIVSDFGIPNSKLIAPGDPSLSILSLRLERLDGMRMPPLASSVVDTQGMAVVNGWIQSITACP